MYAYTFRQAVQVVEAASGRHGIAQEYRDRADEIVLRLNQHCFSGELYADTEVVEARLPVTACIAKSGQLSAAALLAKMPAVFYERLLTWSRAEISSQNLTPCRFSPSVLSA